MAENDNKFIPEQDNGNEAGFTNDPEMKENNENIESINTAEAENSSEPVQNKPEAVDNESPSYTDGYYAYSYNKENQGVNRDFSEYNDSVNNTPKAEPAYSPYSKENSFSSRQDDMSENSSADAASEKSEKTGKKKGKGKKNKGFKAFVISVIAVVLCVTLIVVPYLVKANSKENKPESNGDVSEITLNSAPVKHTEKGELTPESIAASAQKFNVGILVYGNVNSFASSSSNALLGEGSGIVMSKDKKYTYILTCAHVISEAKKDGYTLTVQDYEGNTYDGILVGFDTKTDVGVIKIADTKLHVAEFGDSSKLVLGQKVYAIGNPGGIEFFGSFTNGMISSIDRPINSESGYEMKCIQHTTPINSGNSGGALLNEYGQVIGINSSKIVSTGYEGMAFAIPISDAKPIIDDIIANGRVTNRPKLGISYIAALQHQQYGMIVKLKDLPSGSLILKDISPDSSLAKTDAKVGDLIIAVDGQKLDTPDVLIDKIENSKVGDTIKLTLCRISNDYTITEFTVTAKLIEDNGYSAPHEEPTTQNYWEQFFGSGF